MVTLYRKYRPKTFAEIEGQEHVVQTLRGALESERTGHAYLFCGPRGTGKTTMARLFAKAINCEALHDAEPCNKCFSCSEINAGKSLDLIEIDAASNRGIDEIRNVKESAHVAASSSTYKIFIVDEVHMLTAAAFNALLKTLEEPPSHTLFILATTEPHKVPETILSRVQRFDFKKLDRKQMLSKLRTIEKAEKIAIDDQSLEAIIDAASGSLRDAESALAKVMSYAGAKITGDQTLRILGIIPRNVHEKLLENLAQKQTSSALAVISDLHESGIHLEHFAKQFLDYLRQVLLEQLAKPDARFQIPFLVNTIERFMEAHQEMRISPIPQLPLELAIVDLTGDNNGT